MKITSIIANQVRIPFRRPVKHASHTRTDTDSVVIQCVLEDGTFGLGEGLPRDYVTGETIESSMGALVQSEIPSQLQDCDTFFAACNLAERLKVPAPASDDRQCSTNAARCALELAVLDAYGKLFHEPISSVTKTLAGDLYYPRKSVQYSGIITSARGWKLRLASLIYRLGWFRQVKMKVGIPGQNDEKRVRLARRFLGGGIDLRVDANEAWSLDETVDRILQLKPFGVSSVEQPVPHEQALMLGKVREKTSVPIMFDESLCSMVDAERAVQAGACDLFNLRLSKCGGFIPSLRLAQFARKHGLNYQLGCQVGETAILSAAGRHFACSVADIRYHEGSYDRHLVRESLSKKDITFGWAGHAPALSGYGLGVEWDMDALKRVTTRREVILG